MVLCYHGEVALVGANGNNNRVDTGAGAHSLHDFLVARGIVDGDVLLNLREELRVNAKIGNLLHRQGGEVDHAFAVAVVPPPHDRVRVEPVVEPDGHLLDRAQDLAPVGHKHGVNKEKRGRKHATNKGKRGHKHDANKGKRGASQSL